ncbi:MAG: hypothetical protein SGPRY_003835 [Prymnesium sp.]
MAFRRCGLASLLALVALLAFLSAPGVLLRVGLRQLAGHRFAKQRKGPLPFPSSPGASSPVRVAVVGGGMAGLSAAYTLLESNRYRQARVARAKRAGRQHELRGCGTVEERHCLPPLFNVTLFEAKHRVGGHSWTYRFPLSDGTTYPVDLGYAYNPTMPSYSIIRAFERKHRLRMSGPLQQRVAVLKEGFGRISSESSNSLDRECDRFMALMVWLKENEVWGRLLYGPISLRTALRLHGFSDEFFLYRMYPVIRFVIVAGSKGAMLDAAAIGGFTTFKSGWASCYDAQLHGSFDWYTVANGSDSHLGVFRQKLRRAIRTASPVQSVTVQPSHARVRYETVLSGGVHEESFDAVVMATPPDVASAILGSQAPAWARRCTTEAISVVLHSDERVMHGEGGENGEGGGEGRRANMIYIAKQMGTNYANAALSVYWDSIHGELVKPRPILTYNPEALVGDQKLQGEVFRTRFRHIHLPDAITYLLAEEEVHRAHNAAGGRLYWAGAHIDKFSLSHGGAMQSGIDAAVSLGASISPSFFTWLNDPPGYEISLRKSKGNMLSPTKRRNTKKRKVR